MKVKIILGPVKPDWNRPRDPIITTLRELSKFIEIKTKDDWQGRMIIVDDRIIVGSLDLDRQGMIVHDNLVIETDEQTAIQRANRIIF